MRKTLISIIGIAALAISLNGASAQGDRYHGGGGSRGGGGSPSFVGGGKGGAGPTPSFSASSRNVGGYSRSIGGYNRGALMHAPRLSTGSVQHQYRAMPQYRVNQGVVQHQYRTTPQYRVNQGMVQHQYRTTPHRVSPNVAQHAPIQQHTSRIYTQRKMRILGAHHRRYRHRRHGYTYYYGGWWYASPWWLESYSDYDYWSDVCAYRWGYYTLGYYRCMAYYGFY